MFIRNLLCNAAAALEVAFHYLTEGAKPGPLQAHSEFCWVGECDMISSTLPLRLHMQAQSMYMHFKKRPEQCAGTVNEVNGSNSEYLVIVVLILRVIMMKEAIVQCHSSVGCGPVTSQLSQRQ